MTRWKNRFAPNRRPIGRAINDFLKYSQEVFHEGYEKLVHVPFLSLASMVAVAPQLIRLEAYRSVYSVVAKHIRDPHLRQLFSFHSLLVGGNPFTTTSIYTLIHCLERKWGVFFPKGGTGQLVWALVKLFQELGGEIRFDVEIDRDRHPRRRGGGSANQDRPRGKFRSGGEQRRCGPHLRSAAQRRAARGHDGATARKKKYSMSLFLIYFGTRRKYPNLQHHNVIFGPRYRELLGDIFERGRLADDFSLYLHAPTRSDPSLAPPDCEAFYVLSPVPHLGKLAIDWQVEGPRYAAKILNYLEQRYMPGLTASIVTQRIFTPADFKSELNAHLWLGIFLGAASHAERLFSRAQPRPKYSRSLFCRRGHASRRRHSRRGQFRQGDGEFDSRRYEISFWQVRSIKPTEVSYA